MNLKRKIEAVGPEAELKSAVRGRKHAVVNTLLGVFIAASGITGRAHNYTWTPTDIYLTIGGIATAAVYFGVYLDKNKTVLESLKTISRKR